MVLIKNSFDTQRCPWELLHDSKLGSRASPLSPNLLLEGSDFMLLLGQWSTCYLVNGLLSISARGAFWNSLIWIVRTKYYANVVQERRTKSPRETSDDRRCLRSVFWRCDSGPSTELRSRFHLWKPVSWRIFIKSLYSGWNALGWQNYIGTSTVWNTVEF